MDCSLTRYWIEFHEHQGPFGFGITAVDEADALGLARTWWTEFGVPMPAVKAITVDVDVSTLEPEVRLNMLPPNWRGIWYPMSSLS